MTNRDVSNFNLPKTPAEETFTEEYSPDARAFLKAHPLYAYIHDMWPQLTFTHEDLFLGGARNPILPHDDSKPFYVYISDKEDLKAVQDYYAETKANVIKKIQAGELGPIQPEALLDIEIRTIPRDADGKPNIPFDEHGILHIPHKAVSPGIERYTKGSMYNWDSAFIIRGMVQDGMCDLAKDMLDNLLYQIEHYDGPLNANSTFCIGDDKSRSQLPLLTAKIHIIYNNWDQLSPEKQGNKDEWLRDAVSLVEKHHKRWVSGAHYHEDTGLSMFNTEHEKPGVEVLYGEPEHYVQAYETLCDIFHKSVEDTRPMHERSYQERKDHYYVEQFLERDADGKPVQFQIDTATQTIRGLTGAFFRGDWAMRESGFDPSRRFGFMNVDIINHLPVCLNGFRHKMEFELSELNALLAKRFPDEDQKFIDRAHIWAERAEDTHDAIQEHLWDNGQAQYTDPDGKTDEMPPSFRDKNVSPLADKFNIGTMRRYNFATTFIPMWTGIATADQAKHIVKEIKPLLDCDFGLMTSDRYTGCQWDAPMIWAPLQIMAVEALEKYDYYHTALELSRRYIRAIEAEFDRTGFMWEKLEGEKGTSETGKFIADNVGYDENDKGFGWTIAAYIEIKHAIERLKLKIDGKPVPAPAVDTNFNVVHGRTVRPAIDGKPELTTV